MSLITYLTRVHFADRVLEDALPEELARLNIRRPLVVAGCVGGRRDGLERLFDALPAPGAPATLELGAQEDARRALHRARALATHADCDGFIGFGSRPALGLARLLAEAARPAITIPTGIGGVGLGPLAPQMLAVPGLRAARPRAVLCDATLTLGADPADTAAAGMDTLMRCLESFLGAGFNPPADGIALDGLWRAARNLEVAVQDGSDIAARREMLAAALNAGLAAEKGLGGIEAAANALEDLTGTQHGALHGALLAEVLMFNAPAVRDRYARIRLTLGLPPSRDLAEEFARLAERIGLPARLSERGIAADHLPEAARRAAADPANRTNPRLATSADYERMMRAAL